MTTENKDDTTLQASRKKVLDRLSTFWKQRWPREISFQEAIRLVGPRSWVEDRFGTPANIDIGAFRGALVDDQTWEPLTKELKRQTEPLLINAVTDCRKWLVEQMKRSPYRQIQKEKYFNDAKAKFRDLSERQFNTAWQTAIGDTNSKWGQAGRPEKNPRS